MEKEMNKNYNHQEVEEGKFKNWKKKGYFTASGDVNDPRPAFSMIVPPPNITGVLHIGHALDTTIYDIFARYKKLHGYDVFFCPGTDHAGIATQARVEANLRKEGITRFDLGREKFVEKVWEWKNQTSSTIHNQWEALGIGMDFSRERFTMDEKTTKAVRRVFKTLYDEGLIYQGERIINWDVELQTALSNIEVEHKDIPGKFYYFKYRLANNKDKYFEIATTRPETMFGDVCVVFNPKDERYKPYEGQMVINPANGEEIPMIADFYVDIEFGTGLMKCTPAHDPNDFNIAKRHHLAMPICMNKDGTMNELAGVYKNLPRFECRDKLVEQISQQGDLIKIEDIIHSVGHSERSHTICEPTLSKQWFIKMKPLAKKVLELQKDSANKINFFPSRFEKIFDQWLNNTEDWCISRQLWWGHRVPIFTNKKTGEVVCSETDLDPSIWDQDQDVLDTWFSSGLSPFALCNWPETEDPLYQRYFPLDLMITGYDIIFFWVARMAFDSAHFTNKLPFKNCFIHGLVRDEQGRKMSKSLGNGIDPVEVINQYGVDSLRYALATSITPGLDMSFGYDKIKSAHVFLNKVWNASRFAIMNFDDGFVPTPIEKVKLNFVDQYVIKHLNKTIKMVEKNTNKYELGQAASYLYSFIYDIFCSNYIEEIKVDMNSSRKQDALSVLYYVLKSLLVMLFPYAPFITEEIYSYLPHHKDSIYLEKYPTIIDKSLSSAHLGDTLVEMIKEIRKFKADNKLAPTFKVDILLLASPSIAKKVTPYLEKVGFISSLKIVDLASSDASFRFFNKELAIKVYSEQASKEASQRIEKRIAELKQELERSDKILSNQAFVSKAPKAKIELEQAKRAKYQEELDQYLKTK